MDKQGNFDSGLQLHSALAFEIFDDMRRQNEQTDVVIKIGDRSFPAHRLVLSALSPFFRAMFKSNMKECETNEVNINDIDAVAFASLIDFAYTGVIKITTENVQSLLATADFLQITQVKSSCCEFLLKRLNSSNVINIQTVAENYNCLDLVEGSNAYICEHFEEICQNPEFLGVSFTMFNALIRRDDLNTPSEEKVFEVVMNWVKTDPERNIMLPELLTGVRMTHLKPDYLVKNVSNEKLIRESILCRDVVDEAKHCRLLPNDRSVCTKLKTELRACERKKNKKLLMEDIFGKGFKKQRCQPSDVSQGSSTCQWENAFTLPRVHVALESLSVETMFGFLADPLPRTSAKK